MKTAAFIAILRLCGINGREPSIKDAKDYCTLYEGMLASQMMYRTDVVKAAMVTFYSKGESSWTPPGYETITPGVWKEVLYYMGKGECVCRKLK